MDNPETLTALGTQRHTTKSNETHTKQNIEKLNDEQYVPHQKRGLNPCNREGYAGFCSPFTTVFPLYLDGQVYW